MPRGGRRPGAGAPKGNLNALKHGRRSRQFAEIGAIFANNPEVRKMLLDLADKQGVKTAKSEELALRIFQGIIARGIILGRDRQGRVRLKALPPNDDGRSIVENSAPQTQNAPEKNENLPDNQTPDTNPSQQSATRHENTHD